MKAHLSKQEQEVFGAVKYQPEVSIILPFEPAISLQTELHHQLKIAVGKVESQLSANYPKDKAMLVIGKLRDLVQNIKFDASKKGLAIFVSPLIEKLFYFDFPVNEKIVIGETFAIRDLIYCKKQLIQYLVLQLSGESSKMYLDDGTKFVLLKSDIPQNIHAFERDMPEKVGKFSDPEDHKEILIDNFLHHCDQGLTLILKSYPLPVFVTGTDRVLGHFKKITRNPKSLVEFIPGSYLAASEAELREVIQPYLKHRREIREKALLLQIEEALSEKKLESGIRQVWQAATHKNCRLLLVEKDFMYPARQGSQPDSIYKEDVGSNSPFYIKDAVDGVIEKVLEAGGDVEFVSNGALKDYERIALIRFY
ncbi:hypothetical protein Q4E93_05660 [Flavitalea sp. BT771]|uniref:baeRF3 domain-containing protein n=1 Tax=Flavitalea sp. BT771 TaxID=3063329 RepID=UPI0026E2C161|nr:hypothetical protein [Flavitalea sp. BT771]MDO6430060.1 hypothetical protein [Flavitalea sp. BT771]MDV6219801.1 hypothetical protein [Flavitalea sp. BT771]